MPEVSQLLWTLSVFYKQFVIIEKSVTQRFTKLVGFLVSDHLVLSGLEYCPIRHYEL